MLQEGATPQNPSRVVNVGSVVGMIPQAAPTHAYDVSKAAVHQLTKKLSSDLAPKHITVNALAPGFVATRMSKGLGTWGATEDVIAKSIPLQRMGNEEDMAGACLYLSSRAGAWCTGVILNVDGGTIGGIQVDLGASL
jgi:NAD(P)-dependent dehydrogenase (short-subunit alcohol dehydrogenase family)